jgi:hypothetical protein
MNQREIRLAIALIAILVLGGGWVVFNRLGGWKTSLERREVALAQRKLEADGMLAQRDFWTVRSEWLNAHQKDYTKRNDADTELLNLLRDSAQTHDITLSLSQLGDPADAPGVRAATITVDANGEYAKVWRWLHALQADPTSFISIQGLTIKPNVEDTKRLEVSDLRLQKWFRLP